MPGMAGFPGRMGHGPMDFDAVVLAGGLSKQLYPLVTKVNECRSALPTAFTRCTWPSHPHLFCCSVLPGQTGRQWWPSSETP